MAETKELLERAGRAFDLPSDVMDALVARRDRKRRNERLQAGALGLAIAVAIGWLGVSALRSGPVPADPPPGSWSRVQLEPPVDGGSPASFLVAGPDGLVAVGVDEGPATVWTSADGTAWTRTPAETLDGAAISDITNGDLGFIAVGDSGGERASWTSEDGISWDRLPDPDLGDTLFVSAVEPGGPGFVAVGSWMGAWYSVDGITWERAAVPPVPSEVYPGDDGKTPQIYLSDVAGWRDRLVATGYAMLTSDGNFDHPVAVLWTSRDGRAWTDVPTPAVVFPPDSSISDVTAGPDGFVAVGRVANGQEVAAAIWTSPDGRDWLLHRPGPDGLVLNSVTAGAGGYVAVGATMECDTDCASREAVVMTSVDGETWVTVPSGPDFRVAQPSDPEDAQGAAMFDVVAWGSRFAALGEYDAEPTVWVTTLGDQEDVTTPTLPEPALVAPGTLAYVLDGDVYVADPDGSNAVKIANGRSTEDCYAWSGEYWAEGPMWSPDGRYLAFRRYTDCGNEDDPNPRDVVISDAAGNVVATFPADGWDIGWSPNSSRVAVWDTLFETVGIYGIDGTRLERLTMPSGWQPSGDHDPAWTSDGSLVLSDTVLLDDGDPTNDVARNLEARDDYAATIGIQAISSDGARIATVDGSSLMVGGSDGSGSVALLTVDRGTDLRILGFSPDGDRILFAKNEQPRQGEDAGELWSIGVDGSDARLVVAGTMTGSWRP